MQFKFILAIVAALAGFAIASFETGPALAADVDRPVVKKRTHYHRVPHVRRTYALREDPYAYRYEPRGYYPYYRSDYWRPTDYVRYRNRLHYNVWNTQPPHFRYYKSWGYPVRHWHHKQWHAWAHGRHRPWHW